MTLKAGGASKVINCQVGDELAGQLHRRICQSVRDDLEANVLYLEEGMEKMLLVSCDLVFLEKPFLDAVAEKVSAATGVPARRILIACTHTHDGPNTFQLLPDGPVNRAYLDRLAGWLVEAAREAAGSARAARIGWGRGQAHIGYNRRACWADGTHTMYGEITKPTFTGLEGPDDPSQAVLAAVDADGKPIALIHNNACHATCIESDTRSSADFPGEARALVRSALGTERLPVLYLQGASGDVSPFNLFSPPGRTSPPRRERRLHEVGSLLAAETLRVFYEMDFRDSAVLRHDFEELPLAVRLPTAEELSAARKTVALGPEKAGRGDYVLAASIVRLHEEFQDRPIDVAPVHAFRIGEFAIATNPCEFYCQFGLDIKRRSPAEVTAVAQLANGFCGYCPTIYAVLGGGYSGKTIYWTRLEPFAGYRMVDAASRLLHKLWR